GYPMKSDIRFSMSAEERVKRFKRFIKKARIDTIQVLLPVPLPGTELRQRLMDKGRVYPLKDIGWEYYDGNFPLIEPDPPLTAEEMQISIRKIMGRFYHIRYLFMFIINIFYFPHIVFYFHNIQFGWKRWYRRWRNYIFRILGSKILKNWTYHLQRGSFPEKVKSAKKHMSRKEE
ncbi:MAG: hypothetical protein JW928_06040, partial [Candidatus Aureabacteria bacterium]|nr:hypothetical protein [Candidatus Auribacterota bacterium]